MTTATHDIREIAIRVMFEERRAPDRHASRKRPPPEGDSARRCHVRCAAERDKGLVLEFRIPATSLDGFRPQLETLLSEHSGHALTEHAGLEADKSPQQRGAGAGRGVEPGRAILHAVLDWLVGDVDEALSAQDGAASGDVHHEHLRSILRYIEARIDRGGVTVQGVARHFHVSRRYVYKLFAMDGLQPARYISDLRLRRCREALADPGCSERIEQIACRFGFRDASGFSHAFNRCFGVSPREYRARAGQSSSRESDRAAPPPRSA